MADIINLRTRQSVKSEPSDEYLIYRGGRLTCATCDAPLVPTLSGSGMGWFVVLGCKKCGTRNVCIGMTAEDESA
jgi:hypothetical protein